MSTGDLLKSLGGLRAPGTTPGGGTLSRMGVAGSGVSGGAGALDFARLLSRAREGDVSSLAPVRVGKDTKISLTSEQLGSLAKLADQAEAEGATRAICLIDGAAYALDVATRTITGRVDLTAPGVRTGFDAVLVAPGGGASVAEKAALGPPSASGAQRARMMGALQLRNPETPGNPGAPGTA